MTDSARRRQLGYLVWLLVAGLFLLFAVARQSEPYPAVIMPGFEGARDVEGLILVRQYRITATAADGDRYVDPGGAGILAGIPDQYRPPTIEFLMSDGKAPEPGWFAAIRTENRARNEADMPEFRAWLSDRLESLNGRDGWRTVVFERVEPRYDPASGRTIDGDRVTASWTVRLP